MDAGRIQSDLNNGNTLVRRDATGSFSAGTITANALTVGSVPAVTTTATQTLSNKTISGASNTLSNIPQSAVTSLTTDLAARQTTAQKGVANGYASLDSTGKLPTDQLPTVVSVLSYRGTWNASTNSPTLANGTGTAGHTYRVDTAGTALGSTFAVGDYVIYTGSVWQKSLSTDDATRNAVERTATATLTNKTISGASNTITNLPASATPDVGRQVGTTAQGGSAADNGANTWTRIATFNLNGSSFTDVTATYELTGSFGYLSSTSFTVQIRGTSTPALTAAVSITAESINTGLAAIADDAFKLVSNGGWGTTVDLWFRKPSVNGAFNLWETSRSISSNGTPSITYYTLSPWQAAAPVGSAFNASSSGVTISGEPVVTTTGAQTLTNKTLTSPRVDTILDTAGNALFASLPVASSVNHLFVQNAATTDFPKLRVNGSDADIHLGFRPKGTGTFRFQAPAGEEVFQVVPATSGVNYLRIDSSAAGAALPFRAIGSDANISMNLIPKGTGTVQANGAPVATTTGAQALTNKTISGASNTITNLPASATPDATRFVRNHGTTLNNWYKIFTYSPGSIAYARFAAVFTISAFNNSGAVLSMQMGNLADGQNPTGTVEFLSKGNISVLNDDAFKIVNNGYGQPIELWVQTVNSNGSNLVYHESARYGAAANVIYETSNTGVATEPVGTAVNVRSTAPSINGNPVGVRVAVPASATATGASGQWAADNSWIYVCIASGNWRRAALSTW
jgi:hypothetical protein